MTLKDGDVVTIDDVEFTVTAVYPNTDHYLLTQTGAPSGYFYTIFRSGVELEDLKKDGRLKPGNSIKVKGGNPSCYHSWRRYLGAIPASCYDYCDRCDAKREVNFMRGDK